MQVPISQIEPLFALDAVRVDRYIAMLKDGKTPPPIWRPDGAPISLETVRWITSPESSDACRAENDLVPRSRELVIAEINCAILRSCTSRLTAIEQPER